MWEWVYFTPSCLLFIFIALYCICPDASTYECLFGLDGCSANAICTDTEENYTCVCVPGFSGDGFNCTSIKAIIYHGYPFIMHDIAFSKEIIF